MVSIRQFATKEALVSAARWRGFYSDYEKLKKWTNDNLQVADRIAILQEPTRTVLLRPGDFIVKIGNSFLRFSEEEMLENYTEIAETRVEVLK